MSTLGFGVLRILERFQNQCSVIPTDSKNPAQSSLVIALRAFPIALISALFVRAAAARSSALTFDHIFSMGLRSGE